MFYDLHEASKSELAVRPLEYIGGLYETEREIRDLPPDRRLDIRETKARPIADALHQWMLAHCLGTHELSTYRTCFSADSLTSSP